MSRGGAPGLFGLRGLLNPHAHHCVATLHRRGAALLGRLGWRGTHSGKQGQRGGRNQSQQAQEHGGALRGAQVWASDPGLV